MSLASAKAKLKANRRSGKGAAKHRLTKEDQKFIMAENRKRGGADVGEKPNPKPDPKSDSFLGRAIQAIRDRQSTDSNN